MKIGHVSIKGREGDDQGTIRVDEFAEKLLTEMPQPSDSYNKFYERVWKAEDYAGKPAPSATSSKPIKAQPAKLAKEPAFVNIPFVGAPSVPIERYFTEILTELESKLSKMNDLYFGGKTPSLADREYFDMICEEKPDSETYPHTYAWYTIVSRFNPEMREKWAGLGLPKKSEDWKNVFGKFASFNFTLIYIVSRSRPYSRESL